MDDFRFLACSVFWALALLQLDGCSTKKRAFEHLAP